MHRTMQKWWFWFSPPKCRRAANQCLRLKERRRPPTNQLFCYSFLPLLSLSVFCVSDSCLFYEFLLNPFWFWLSESWMLLAGCFCLSPRVCRFCLQCLSLVSRVVSVRNKQYYIQCMSQTLGVGSVDLN